MARLCQHLCVLLAGLGGLLGGAPPARAYEEQASLDAALGYQGTVDAAHLPSHAASFDLGGGRGLGDAVVLRGSLGYLRLRDPYARTHAGRARLEGLYLIDVLRAVPFIGVGASLLLARAPDGPTLHPGAHLLVGIDYLISRRFVLGLDVRPGLVVDDGHTRSTTEVAVRLSRMFELF